MLTRLRSAGGLESNSGHPWHNVRTRPPMYFCQRYSKSTYEESAVGCQFQKYKKKSIMKQTRLYVSKKRRFNQP